MSIETRQKMLELHNKLKPVLDTIHECKDLWLSDVKDLEDIMYTLRHEFNFKAPVNDEGQSEYWRDTWVLGDNDDKE